MSYPRSPGRRPVRAARGHPGRTSPVGRPVTAVSERAGVGDGSGRQAEHVEQHVKVLGVGGPRRYSAVRRALVDYSRRDQDGRLTTAEGILHPPIPARLRLPRSRDTPPARRQQPRGRPTAGRLRMRSLDGDRAGPGSPLSARSDPARCLLVPGFGTRAGPREETGSGLTGSRAGALPACARLPDPPPGFGLNPVLVGQRASETAKGLKPCRRRMWGTIRIMASVARAVLMSPRSSICSCCQPRSPSTPVTVFFASSSLPER